MNTVAPPSATQDPRIAELLAQLHAPIAPNAIGLWPPAVGWWLLIAIGIAVLALLIRTVKKRSKRNAYRKLALSELTALSKMDLPEEQTTKIPLLAATLLKRTCIAAYPVLKTHSAGLYGKQWFDWLTQSANLDSLTAAQTETLLSLTGEAKYSAESSLDPELVFSSCRYWIEKHVHVPESTQHQWLRTGKTPTCAKENPNHV
ncbi:DUF4381 domain-containing protein [Teredinibacter purpureus]|uniref:DUF4381 domain-containing protein n=1 Tax=Teredinibacter purpureus TaxID=2731756 RepID=UPI000695F639|nr:DUF4381 domain-containing protein [Teredinibacter purpureus]